MDIESTFHLTARPWKPLDTPREAYLDAIEGVCRFTIRHQNDDGAVIDPFLGREHQYSTPYFAYAVGTLMMAGRALDIWERGVRAMDHATACFARGRDGIPDQHGEFFIAPLAGALRLYAAHAAPETMALWQERLRTPLAQVIQDNKNNWRTYAMKGEWLRAAASLVARDAACEFVRASWLHATQRDRIAGDQRNLYQDHTSDPESHAVEAVGRGNLLALIAAGYDGEFRDEITQLVERGSHFSLLLQDPSGQCPPNGRTDDHVFNDVLYQLVFEVMAERMWKRGGLRRAGQYRRAALLALGSITRWRRSDGEWNGSYFVTKNHFDPQERVGYQEASNYGNYNGAIMLHLAEAFQARQSEIAEQPAPSEIGGYAVDCDPRFASVVANAGGMQLFANLRGDTKLVYNNYWTPLGVVRFARVGWDSCLGPTDGVRDARTGRGISFAPTWRENGQWVRLADVPERYEGVFSVQFAHPLLVRCAIEYHPLPNASGPTFRHMFVLTPEGVFARLSSLDAREIGVTWPLLENDGTALHTTLTARRAATRYFSCRDEQNFLALHPEAFLTADEPAIRSPYGWLRPIRLTTQGSSPLETFVFPRNRGEPEAETVCANFHIREDGFSSPLGQVHGNLYMGRTAAGGEGEALDLNNDGKADVTFNRPCSFVLQLKDGLVYAAEADRSVIATIQGRKRRLRAYTPAAWP